MRRLNFFALILMIFSSSFAGAWENPLVSVGTSTSQAVKEDEGGSSSTSLSTIKRANRKRKKKFEQKVEQAVNPNSKGSMAFSASVGADHTAGFNKDVDPVSTLSIGLNLKFNDVYRIGLSQSFSKFYFVNVEEKEVKAEDTVFSAAARLYSSDILSIQQSLSATAPVSETSRQYEIMTRVAANTSFTFAIVDRIVSFSLTPGGTYSFNRYATSPISLDGGGQPLQLSTAGIAGSLNYQVTDKWDANLSASYKRIFYEKVPYENEVSDLGLTNPPVHSYAFSLGTSYTFFDAVNLSLSVAQADRVEKYGGLEVLVYDEMNTLWSMGLTYSF